MVIVVKRNDHKAMTKVIACLLPDVENFRNVAVFLLKRCNVISAVYQKKEHCESFNITSTVTTTESIGIHAITLKKNDIHTTGVDFDPEKSMERQSVLVYANNCPDTYYVMESLIKEFDGYFYLLDKFDESSFQEWKNFKKEAEQADMPVSSKKKNKIKKHRFFKSIV